METVHGSAGERVHTYLERITPFGFAGAALVALHGEVLLNHGYGISNRVVGTPNRAETIFNLGSITKQFTAAAIFRLEMQGLLSTEDRLGRFFPGIPADKREITLHHLLTHTAGTPTYTGEDYEAAGRDETVQKILEAPLLVAPGSTYRYSNAGYSLLAALIELVAGEPYEQFISEQLFQPAGMRATGYRLPAWEASRLARGYIDGKDMGTPIEKSYPSWNVMGNGEMLSTTTDMYRWYMALKNGQVLDEAARQKLWTPFLQDYACGWLVHETKFGLVREHNGAGDTGMSADLKWYPDGDVFIVLFGSQTLPNGMLPITAVDQKISALVFDRPVALPPAIHQKPNFSPGEEVPGTYSLESGAQFIIRRQPDGLVLHPANQTAIHAIWEAAPGYEDLNRRAENAFGSLAAGDNRALAAELKDPKRLERFQNYLEEAILHGSPDCQWRLVGTLPAGDGQRIISLMVFEAGCVQATLEIYWEQNRLLGLRLLDGIHPLGILLCQAAEHHFIGYDLATGRVIDVKRKNGTLEIQTAG